MYDDDVQTPLSLSSPERYYKVAKFPTRNIKTPIVLVYGGSDSLVDIKVMLKELPRHTIAKEIPHFEHLDFLWGQDVDKLVFPHVFTALQEHAGRDHLRTMKFFHKKHGHIAHGSFSEFSEDDVSSLPTDNDRPAGADMALSRQRRDGPSHIDSPRHEISTAPTSISSDGVGEKSPSSPGMTPDREHRKDQGRRRAHSGQSIEALKAKTYGGGIAVGVGKAVVGDVSS